VTANQIFSVANLVAGATWLVLALFPRRRWATHVAAGAVVPALFSGAYVVIIAATFREAQGGFSSLPEVALLFSDPWLLLAGWIHYLAFDLLVGAWEVRDSQQRRIPHLLVVPCLALTFMFGPAGWLLYMGLRTVRKGAADHTP
jgi:Domain of unknown function (DUF4281)